MAVVGLRADFVVKSRGVAVSARLPTVASIEASVRSCDLILRRPIFGHRLILSMLSSEP